MDGGKSYVAMRFEVSMSDFITGFIVGFLGGVFALHWARDRFPDD